MSKPIYPDYNATTRLAVEEIDSMIPYLYEEFGNSSSNHLFGFRTKDTIEKDRREISDLLNCCRNEII